MSRDWTPQELHRADVITFRKRGTHLYESTFVWVDSDGTKRPFVHKDYQYKDMFPSLSFLGEGIAYTLIETYHTDRNFIKEIEDILTKIREEDVPDGTIHEDEYGSDIGKTVYEWYRGLSLGSIQYDSRYNNEAFIEKAVGIFRETLAGKDLFPTLMEGLKYNDIEKE